MPSWTGRSSASWRPRPWWGRRVAAAVPPGQEPDGSCREDNGGDDGDQAGGGGLHPTIMAVQYPLFRASVTPPPSMLYAPNSQLLVTHVLSVSWIRLGLPWPWFRTYTV